MTSEAATAVKAKALARNFGVVMAWTTFTTVFVWLPIVRAIARPDGYEWGLFGLRGVGFSSAFWIFPVLTLYAVLLFAHAWWRNPGLFRVLLLVWHLGWTGLLVSAVLSQGLVATWQGQGWGFTAPLWGAAIIYAAFACLVARWAYLDWHAKDADPVPRWTIRNTRRLGVSLALLPVALMLFRFGINYNWVTALAIIVTIVQWVVFAESLEAAPIEKKAAPA